MEFRRFTDFPNARFDGERYRRYLDTIKEYRRALGWEEIPEAQVPTIMEAWSAHLQHAHNVAIPRPSRTWRGRRLARAQRAPALEADFTLKLLGAFRRCTRPGERLWVIDWQHPWYYFDPHGGVTAATRDEWALPVLPDGGDEYNYVAPDFRFGLIMGYRMTGPVTLFGAGLLTAFDADPPERFLQVCGPGKLAR
jgi:hypothetical protein